MKKTVLILLSFLLFGFAKAQYFSTGEDPARTKYSFYKTEHFKIVFPTEASSYALPLGAMLEQSYRNAQFFPQYAKAKKIEVLLHTRNSASNGYVVWAPKRMELMMLPPFQFGALSWERELAIHEFRHVSQISTFYKGFTGLSYYVLGEQGIGAMTAFAPSWFYEGDAVVAETAFSQSGRGRDSEFLLPYKTRLAEGYRFSFDQYLNGSYKTYIPNYYKLGYMLNSYGRVRYGSYMWDSVMRFTTRNPFLGAAFSFGIKKYTGETRSQLFASSLNMYDSVWNGNGYTKSGNRLKLKKNVYATYSYPLRVKDAIYAFKSTLDRNPVLVSIDSTGNEKVLKTVQSPNSQPTTDGRYIYWTEYASAGRWAQVLHSVVKRYDIQNKRLTRLSDLGFYSFPSVSNGSIAVFSYLPSNEIYINVYDSTFKLTDKRAVPFSQAKELQWGDGCFTYTTLDKMDNMLVVKQLLTDNRIDTLFNFGRRNISSVKVNNNGTITFISDFSGKSAVYEYNTANKTLAQLLVPKYGSDSYIVNGDDLYFTSYTINGYRVAHAPIQRIAIKDSNLNVVGYPIAEKLSAQVNVNLQDSTDLKSDYPLKRYRRVPHLFNLHSWAPFYFDPTEVQNMELKLYPGITLISQNLLSTSNATFAYGFVERNHVINLGYSYKGFLPIVNFTYKRLNEYPDVFRVKNHTYVLDSNRRRTQVGINTYIPIRFMSGTWTYLVQPYAGYTRYNDVMFSARANEYKTGYEEVVFYTYLAAQTQVAPQNIFPRWGVNFFFKNVSAPFESENLGRLFAYKLGITTPGILPNHGFMTRFCYQNQDIKKYYFSNAFALPRGYTYSYVSKYYKASFNDYSFPLAYPDANLSWLLYVKRLRMNLFADFAENTYMTYKKGSATPIYPSTYYSSVGSDLLFDVNVLRSAFPITMGLRFAYNNDGTTYTNAIFTIAFY